MGMIEGRGNPIVDSQVGAVWNWVERIWAKVVVSREETST